MIAALLAMSLGFQDLGLLDAVRKNRIDPPAEDQSPLDPSKPSRILTGRWLLSPGGKRFYLRSTEYPDFNFRSFWRWSLHREDGVQVCAQPWGGEHKSAHDNLEAAEKWFLSQGYCLTHPPIPDGLE